ncbi:DUF2779 domain-containing protein [Rhodohalobacter sp.]|uniref:DUF2779 domain-containing protein n=1 Tax=Rhodohalobacter sp. TaxID=1974210 RepID=UPI002ACDA8CD|nr:DUF2779 domain-containing protein [Rhodohalobacter sp.]MDZ7755320.1 DUF2779 domain-containing protein [Rhodohalobacter sp.]
MAGEKEINDSLFLKAISCPLKLYHYSKSSSMRSPYLPFKQRNKLQLRNAVAFQFSNLKFTSDSTIKAEQETSDWLSEENVAICGAVLRDKNFTTRIPILIKNGKSYTIVQVHGKLKKRLHDGVVSVPVLSKTTNGYLVKAAYRREILKRAVGSSDIKVDLYFPDKRYNAAFDGIMQIVSEVVADKVPEKVREEFQSLFTKMDATEAAVHVSNSLPESVSHTFYANKSVSDVLEDIDKESWENTDRFGVEIHQECSYCEFRKPEREGISNCWTDYFSGDKKNFPNEHVFDLIGHGNNDLIEKNIYYQEDYPLKEGARSFDEIREKNPYSISIQQRRELQILKAKKEFVPDVWVKESKLALDSLEYPLHFIDFEAATYALPMHRNGGAYHPIYFQFSCHSLSKDGEITHYEWLDDREESGYPHVDFVHHLASVKDIFNGSLIQYSPFESQALRYLLQEMNRNSMLYEKEIRDLKNLLYVDGNTNNHRIFDLSKSVREGYYNRFMSGSIGLKQVLNSIFQLNSHLKNPIKNKVNIYDKSINFEKLSGDTSGYNPYVELQDPVYSVDDGESAMNAYISLKSGLLSNKEKEIIPNLLRRYCAMDSYALFIIYSHLKNLISLNIKLRMKWL